MDNVVSLNSQASPNETNPIRLFFEQAASVLFSPLQFFHSTFLQLSTGEVLTLGILSSWLAAMVAFLWSTVNGAFLRVLFSGWAGGLDTNDGSFDFFNYDKNDFLFSAGFLLLNPFLTLLKLLISTCILFVFSRLLITETHGRELSFNTCLKILAAAFVGNWLAVVPIFGGILAYLAILVLTISGLHAYFSISLRRATLVVFLPRILLVFLAFFVFFSFLFLLCIGAPIAAGLLGGAY